MTKLCLCGGVPEVVSLFRPGRDAFLSICTCGRRGVERDTVDSALEVYNDTYGVTVEELIPGLSKSELIKGATGLLARHNNRLSGDGNPEELRAAALLLDAAVKRFD